MHFYFILFWLYPCHLDAYILVGGGQMKISVFFFFIMKEGQQKN